MSTPTRRAHGSLRRPFTIVELLVVMGTIFIIMALLIPVLSKSREKAKLDRWEGYMRDQRVSPLMVLQYMFLEDASASSLANSAQGVDIDGYERDRFLGRVVGNVRWTEGRWFGKKALQLNGTGSFIVTETRVDTVDPVSSEYTILLWIRPAATNSQVLYSNRRTGTPAVTFELDGSNRLLTRIGSAAFVSTHDELVAEENVWCMVALVQDPTLGIVCYRFADDGTRDSERLSLPPDLHAPPAETETVGTGIGAWTDDGTSPNFEFTGDIGELVVYQRALDENELLDSFRMGRP